MAESKKLLFSVTAKDCRFDYYRGSGKGGQKRNKTSNAVRCTHIASGAVGQAEDTRSLITNKQRAFRRMAESKKFQNWHKIETARRTGVLAQVDEWVEEQMTDRHVRAEGKEGGRWVQI